MQTSEWKLAYTHSECSQNSPKANCHVVAEEFEKTVLMSLLLAPTDTFFINRGALYAFNSIVYVCFRWHLNKRN